MESNPSPQSNAADIAPPEAAAQSALEQSTPEFGRTSETAPPSSEPGAPIVLPSAVSPPTVSPSETTISVESQIAEVQAVAPPLVKATSAAPGVEAPPSSPGDAAPQVAQAAETPLAATGTLAEPATPTSASSPASPTAAFLPSPTAPPRSLVPGAFLRGEYEVKSVLSRGLTNIYTAQSGDYGSTQPVLISEREAQSTPEIGRTFESSLFPAGETFAQDEREYRVYEFFDSTSLQDFRAPTNDEKLLVMLHALAHGLAELEVQNLHAGLTTETLRVAARGDLKFLGFVSPKKAGDDALGELREITDYLLKHVFAESSTMRLDDRFAGLALSEEVKNLARRIDADAPQPFSAIEEVVAALDAIYQPRALLVDAALLSDVGQERELNEDAGLIIKTQRAAHLGTRAFDLYVVSDGMGGHEGGEVASDLTLTSLQKNLDALQLDWSDNVAIRAALFDVMDAVNAEVVALTETPKYRGTRAKPGATLVFALRLGARCFVCNVGDSRAYKFNAQGLARVSKDHSYVQSLVDRGEISDDEAWDHPEGSIITAHIGYPKLKTRDVFLRLCAPGDTLLLVSDGVVDMLRDREIQSLLQGAHAQNEDAATICRDLIDASNAAGGLDNITALCVIFK